jgi:hypothetical protein
MNAGFLPGDKAAGEFSVVHLRPSIAKVNPFQSNFSSIRIHPSSYLF